jgi:hypothetical protein
MTQSLKLLRGLAFGLVAFACGTQSMAQTTTLTSTATIGPIPVLGSVPTFCTGGTVSDGGGAFNLGVLIDQTTGFLRADLAAPPKTVNGAFCNAPSNVTIAASRMVPTSFSSTPPVGFSAGVDFVATATGWTATPASTSTATTTNAGATQSRPTPGGAVISIGISGFSTQGGATLRPVADPVYRGQVVLTLTVVS